MSKMMKSKVCSLRLHDEFVNSRITVLCGVFFLQSWQKNSNDAFPFCPGETRSRFCVQSQGQWQMNSNSKQQLWDVDKKIQKIKSTLAWTHNSLHKCENAPNRERLTESPPFAYKPHISIHSINSLQALTQGTVAFMCSCAFTSRHLPL